MAKANTQTLCFMCGTSHGDRARERVGYVRIGMENFWERMLRGYDLDKPFGIEFGTGRGGLREQERFGIEDPRAERFVEPMRKLVLLAVRRAIRIGLVSKEQILEAIEQESS